jgi:hypothetical protein
MCDGRIGWTRERKDERQEGPLSLFQVFLAVAETEIAHTTPSERERVRELPRIIRICRPMRLSIQPTARSRSESFSLFTPCQQSELSDYCIAYG